MLAIQQNFSHFIPRTSTPQMSHKCQLTPSTRTPIELWHKIQQRQYISENWHLKSGNNLLMIRHIRHMSNHT